MKPKWLRMLKKILGVYLPSGCAVNPATGKREFTLVTPAQEAAMGREGYAAAAAEFGVYDDAALAAYVDSVGRRVARASEQPDLPWKFTVLDDPVVNAFAMPGGYIYVTRGLLAHMQSEAQLAGVLGHEIGHVTARHSARQITQQQLAGLGLGIAAAVSPEIRRYSPLAEQALGLLMLKYSRDDESQAPTSYSLPLVWPCALGRRVPAALANWCAGRKAPVKSQAGSSNRNAELPAPVGHEYGE